MGNLSTARPGLFGLLALLAGLFSISEAAAAPGCTGPFEATVHQGPDTGLALVGNLTFHDDGSGGLTGTLVLGDGSEVAVVGQANGRAINLLFALGPGLEGPHIYGVGTASHNIRECTGDVGGPLVGPQPGSSGDWAFCPNGY